MNTGFLISFDLVIGDLVDDSEERTHGAEILAKHPVIEKGKDKSTEKNNQSYQILLRNRREARGQMSICRERIVWTDHQVSQFPGKIDTRNEYHIFQVSQRFIDGRRDGESLLEDPFSQLGGNFLYPAEHAYPPTENPAQE
jgi:hypothetical protein